MKRITELLRKQKEFQQLVGFPVDSVIERDRNELSEKYIFKLIEEAVELRKEFPSVANPWSKAQKSADIVRIKEELSDVILFLINIINVWKLSIDDVLETLSNVQHANFTSVKKKKMDLLNSDVLKIPGRVSGVGSGSLSPQYIFIGQNPGQSITQGYAFWSDPNDGSSKVLLPLLQSIGILDKCYFTNVVKCTTELNKEPSGELAEFYYQFLEQELELLKYDSGPQRIIAMGNWTSDFLTKHDIPHNKINHPASIMYQQLTREEYEKQIREAITLGD